ncbi:MAG: hypothetical protein MUC83_18910, partial [Pirellula sp.]|nr:hypothetical protein [Pirellula sp.]
MNRNLARKTDSNSSDTMIWLSGGFFVVSCTLLFLFVVHIVYESWQAHWPRKVAVFERTDGTLVAGEEHGYLDDHQTAQPSRLLLKTGYHRNYSQSLSAIPIQTLVQDAIIYPEEIIALELRDTEPVFGLISKVTQLQHSLQTKVALARVFATELELSASKNPSDSDRQNAFEKTLPSSLASLVSQANEPIEIPVERWNEALANFEQIVARNNESIRLKQLELSEIDKQLSSSRKRCTIHADFRSQSFLKTIDEIFRVAFELGAAEQATYDLEASAKFWRDQFQDETAILDGIDESLGRLKSVFKMQQQQLGEELELLIKQDATSNAFESIEETNEAGKILSEIAQTAKTAYADQLRVNTELAELDLIRNAFRIEVAMLDCVNNIPTSTPNTIESAGLGGIHFTRVDQSLEF